MTYSFDIDHAQKWGVDEAILLHNFVFWIRHNRANGKGFKEGRTWTYNTLDAFVALFPFWNRDKIYRIIKSLCEQGLLRKGNFNEKNYDKTCWYSLEDETLLQICNVDIVKMQHRHCETATPIPDGKQDESLLSSPSEPAGLESSSSVFHERQIGEVAQVKAIAETVLWRKRA